MLKLKFGMLPGHWGLKGKTREIAKAEYELSGTQLKKRLLEIRKDDFDEDTYRTKMWDIELEAGEINESEYNRLLTTLIKDSTQKEIATAELDFREGKVTQLEYEKQSSTLRGEPWVTVINMDFGKTTALEGSFELDWNDCFVKKLKNEGYTGPTDDIIVNQWFMEVCRNVAMEEFDGTGDFASDSKANLDTMKRWSSQAEPIDKGRKGYS